MRHQYSWGFLFVIVLLASCGTSSRGTSVVSTGASRPTLATIKMDSGDFIGSHAVTIKAGQSVVFTFPDQNALIAGNLQQRGGGGGAHVLVTGVNGTFSPVTGAPEAFANDTGIPIHRGGSVTVSFLHVGTFSITCTIHPAMQVTITVTA